jgi:hypothetical protein
LRVRRNRDGEQDKYRHKVSIRCDRAEIISMRLHVLAEY